jgi:protein-S-isoprenylcysteine O-methyltransferase Ste14
MFVIIVSLILFIIFIVNYAGYWIISIRFKKTDTGLKRFYLKAYPFIWKISIYIIPIINSSWFEPFFTENVSYFKEQLLWFILLGIIFIGLGFRILSLSQKAIKSAQSEGIKLVNKGVYKIVRHPFYLAWFLIFLGLVFIWDSFIGVILSPILFTLSELQCYLEEKYIFIPKFKKEYYSYRKKIHYRIISPPYSYLLVILALLVIYLGFLNLVLN